MDHIIKNLDFLLGKGIYFDKLILADEPTGALDVNTGNEIMNILEELNKQGKTIVIVTHDPGIAARTQRILFMEDGKIGENVDEFEKK